MATQVSNKTSGPQYDKTVYQEAAASNAGQCPYRYDERATYTSWLVIIARPVRRASSPSSDPSVRIYSHIAGWSAWSVCVQLVTHHTVLSSQSTARRRLLSVGHWSIWPVVSDGWNDGRSS